MFTLISVELYKIFKKWRTYIGFFAIAALTFIIQIAFLVDSEFYLHQFSRTIQNNFFFTGNILNGNLVAYMILQAMYIHIPFLVVLVGGDILASEATMGTYRFLVSRPVSRTKIVLSKFIAGSIYVLSLIIFIIIVSLGLGHLLFGDGELLVFGDPIMIFARGDILWRFIFVYLYAFLSLLTVFSLSFLFSSLVENSVGPIVATMAVIIVFFIITNINIEVLEIFHPYLFTSYMGNWNIFLTEKIDIQKLFISVSVLLIHIIGFLVASLVIFNKKDILC